MQSAMQIGPVSNLTPMSKRMRAALWGTGIFLLAFGLLTLETAVSIWNGKTYLALGILDLVLSRNFAWGGESGYAGVPDILSQYYAKSGRMVLHIAMGGIVVGLGMSQFVPSLRRRHPALHRQLGMLVVLAMTLSMVGALAYLLTSTVDRIFSGPTFYFFLWGLAVLALFLLAQAGLAILSRDFRSHMVWMAACFATFLTAPLLRADWIMLGLWLPMSLQRANAAIAPMVLVQSVFVMLLWLVFLGDKDLPIRKPQAERWVMTRWPRWVLGLFAVVTVGVALLEGGMLPMGLAAFPWTPESVTVLPKIAGLWACTTAIAAYSSLDAWDDWMHGFQPRVSFLVSLALCGASALAVGYAMPAISLDSFTWAFFWKCLGVLQLSALLLALHQVPNSLGRNSWGVFSLFVLWTPAWIPVFAMALKNPAVSQFETLIASATLAIGGMSTAGIATAMGARLRWKPN